MQGLSWINGTLSYRPQVSAYDRGLLVADGLFETIRVEKSEVVDFDAHYERLTSGLAAFAIKINFTKTELLSATRELIHKSSLDNARSRLRLTVTRGAVGETSTVIITIAPYKQVLAPLELVLTGVIRIAGNPSSKHKTLAYTDNFYAQRQVVRAGKNRIAVLRNQWGRVACGSIGNVFVRSEEAWITPFVSEGALAGITRGKLLALGKYRGLPVKEGQVSVEQFLASEALLTNVLRGVEHATATSE